VVQGEVEVGEGMVGEEVALGVHVALGRLVVVREIARDLPQGPAEGTPDLPDAVEVLPPRGVCPPKEVPPPGRVRVPPLIVIVGVNLQPEVKVAVEVQSQEPSLHPVLVPAPAPKVSEKENT